MTSRVVPQILPGAALGSSAGRPLGSLAFPAAGGVQAIDKTGAVLYVSTSPTPSDAALLAATQTFKGVNTFQPVNGTRAANVATPLFDIDVSSVQTLTSPGGKTQAGVRITAPTFDAGAGPNLDAAITLLIGGPPTGLAVGPGTDAYSLAVFSGETLLNGPTTIGGNLTVQGDLAFQTNYTITNASANSPIVTALGFDYKIQVRSTGILALDGGATGSVSVGTTAGVKVGFYATAPIVKQTTVAITAAGIHTALKNLGLIDGP